jgi:hypothetical protein
LLCSRLASVGTQASSCARLPLTGMRAGPVSLATAWQTNSASVSFHAGSHLELRNISTDHHYFAESMNSKNRCDDWLNTQVYYLRESSLPGNITELPPYGRGRKRDIASMEPDVDSDCTPRGKRLRRTPYDRDTEEQSSMGSEPTTSTTSRSQSRPSKSPTKCRNLLAAQRIPLDKYGFDQLKNCTLPTSTRAMLANVLRCSKGTHTIPFPLKNEILARDFYLDPDDNVWRPEKSSSAGNDCTQPAANTDQVPPREPSNPLCTESSHLRSDSSLPQTYDLSPDLPQVEMIVAQAQQCNDMDDMEAGWNSHVHGPLLVLACYLSRHRNRVKSVNLTLARCLARLGPSHRIINTGKTVDFGIYLELSPELRAAYPAIEPEADGQLRYFNHTNFEQIAQRPLVISVETKREGHGGAQADLQLSVWVNAHFERLADLRKTALDVSDRTIWLPLLRVIGPIWYLVMARGDYNDSGELARTTVYSSHLLGDVTTYHGIFQVLSALHELIDWTETSYRPWFERWVSCSQQTGVVAA